MLKATRMKRQQVIHWSLFIYLSYGGQPSLGEIFKYDSIHASLAPRHATNTCILSLARNPNDEAQAKLLSAIIENPEQDQAYLDYAGWVEASDPAHAEFIRLQIANEPIRERIATALRHLEPEATQAISPFRSVFEGFQLSTRRRNIDLWADGSQLQQPARIQHRALFIISFLARPRDMMIATPYQVGLLNEYFLPQAAEITGAETDTLIRESTLFRENASRWIGQNIGTHEINYQSSKFRKGFFVGVELDILTEPLIEKVLLRNPSLKIVRPGGRTRAKVINFDEAILRSPRALPLGETLVRAEGRDERSLRIRVTQTRGGFLNLRKQLQITVEAGSRDVFNLLDTYNKPFFAIFTAEHEVSQVLFAQTPGTLIIRERDIPPNGYISLVGIAQSPSGQLNQVSEDTKRYPL